MPTFESKVSFLQVNIIAGEKKIENHGSLPFWKMPEGSSIKQENATQSIRKYKLSEIHPLSLLFFFRSVLEIAQCAM